MASPFINVVLPVFNGEKFIVEALDSICEQERLPDRLIIVDDGSTDDTPQIAREFRDRSHPFDVQLITTLNGGRCAALNRALARIDQGIVAFLDADDLWLPFHLAKLGEVFSSVPDLTVAFADAVGFVDDDEVVISSYLASTKLMGYPTEPCPDSTFRVLTRPLTGALIPGSFIANCSAAVDALAAKSIGGFDVRFRYVEDRDFWIRLSRTGRWGYFPEAHSRVRFHEANVTGSHNRYNVLKNRAKLTGEILADLRGIILTDDERLIARKAYKRHLSDYRFHASETGLDNYLQAFKLHHSWKSRMEYLADIRSFLRALVGRRFL